MNVYPTENSLTINSTHAMLSSLEGSGKRVAATSPTRVEEKGLGYDVQLSDVIRLQFQYKRPVNIHNKYGMTFEINGDQVGILSLRDNLGTPYLACPWVENRGQLPKSLKNCYFIKAHAVRSDVSRLYIPHGFPSNPVRTKVENESKYPTIPRSAVKSWSDIKRKLDVKAIGQLVRKNGRKTKEYEDFLIRLQKISKLSRASPTLRLRSDGGEDHPRDGDEPNQSNRDEFLTEEESYELATELVEHAMTQFDEVYQDTDYQPGYDGEESALWKLIQRIAGTKDPQVHGIRHSRELIYEVGNKCPSLQLGQISPQN